MPIIVRLHQMQTQQEEGYVMITAVTMMLVLLSLMAAYLLMTDIERSTTRSFADSNSGFYAAESGLNLRAEAIRQDFQGYNRPSGVSPTSMDACINQVSGSTGSGDFACQAYSFQSHNANTYVKENPDNINPYPTISVIPRGELYQNLNMQEYTYRIFSVASKSGELNTEAILQMDLKSRVVPLFQFAAFYQNDLEILPSPTMTLNGPVHTNGSLYLGSNTTLTINGQVTTVGNLFNSRKNNNNTYPNGRVRIPDGAGTIQNLLSANNGTPTTSFLSPANLKSIWGNQIQVGVEAVTVPSPSFLNASGDYFKNADLRIQYQPTSTVPVTVTAINRTSSSTVTFSEGQLRSLMQPVMIVTRNTQEQQSLCRGTFPTPPSITPALTNLQAQAVVKALQVAIASQTSPISFSSISQPLTGTGIDTTLLTLIASLGLSNPQIALLTASTPAQIAALQNNCFTAAPLQVNNSFYNNREQRSMQILQMNMKGLTLWNRDGIYLQFSNGTLSNNNNGNGFSADQLLFQRAAADSNAPTGSFQNLGLAASDRTEGGLVVHETIDANSFSTAGGTQSPYGFAITNGANIPGPLTIASDQAVYVQGDYNNINKQPASVLADSMNVLSNACLNLTTNALNCGISGSMPNAAHTTINAAFLAGTDISGTGNASGSNASYSGGLENYPRFHENWDRDTLTYRGSFVSLGTPQHVNGTWIQQIYFAPDRNWDYDTDFNNFALLPPLSPQFVYLRQVIFVRIFDR